MKISVISINYNNSALTLNFINSLIKHTSNNLSYEIIVVDNCSEWKDYQNLKLILKGHPKVKLVQSKINLGFGGGNMLGVQYATGNYFAFINNDVIFVEDCLSSLIQLMKKDNFIGVSTPQQYNRYNKPVTCFDHFHGIRKVIFGKWLVEVTSKKQKRVKKHYENTFEADFIQGCFMFFDAKKFAEIGGFDTNLFLYYEEMDICYRLMQKGYISVVHPETSFMHLHGESTQSNFLIKKELKISQFYVLRKNHNYIKYNIIRIFILIKTLFKSLVKPKYWNLVYILFTGKYLENSLKQKQQIVFFNEQ